MTDAKVPDAPTSPSPLPYSRHRSTPLHVSALDGVVDPRAFTPEANFGAGGLARTLVEVDRSYSDVGVVWQEDVYELAREIAIAQRHARIVDFGAGAGAKFLSTFAGLQVERVQVDWDDRRESVASPDSGEESRFVTANLEDAADVERVAVDLAGGPATLFLLSDVIEHLGDPRPLLRVLRRLLRDHPANRLVISTPDRERTDGYKASRLPDNEGHVRQWTMPEFGLALLSAGFLIDRIGHVDQNNFDRDRRTVAAELRCTPESYAGFLALHRLPAARDQVAITTEHADALVTGGIGSYYRYSDEACGTGRVYLFVGAAGLPDDWLPFVRDRGWIHVAELCGRAAAPIGEVGTIGPDEVLQSLQHVLFLYDDVRLVEYQDYLGIGSRVAQAKRARLLPPTVTVCAYAHGSHFYLDHSAGSLSLDRDIEIDARERISLEQADIVIFPSRFLHDLYTEAQGLELRKVIHQAYPIQFKRPPTAVLMRRQIDTLLFYGKQTPQKGYPEFCNAVVDLFANPLFAEAAGQIRRIILMGVTHPDERLVALPEIELEYGSYSLEGAVMKLVENAPRALAILPYKGDNHPLSVSEVVGADCQLLAFAAGGLPEIMPAELHDQLLCAPNAPALAHAVSRLVLMPFWDRAKLLDETRALVKHRSEGVTWNYRMMIHDLKSVELQLQPERRAVSLIVPNLNGEAHFFEDLAIGVRNSFLTPARVHLVDDGSDEAGRLRLQVGATHLSRVPHSVTYNSENRGLAGARNAGLAEVETPYVCAHDNDNIILNRYLDLACRILDENPEVAAVTSWSWSFKDGSSWRARRPAWDYEYRPLGQDLGLALRENCIGDALAVYRTKVLQELGGWDDSSKALWEDWQLFTRMTARGHKVWVIPQPMFLYRLRSNSMHRSYATLPGELRLARSLEGLPRADALSVTRSIRQIGKAITAASQALAKAAEHRRERMKQIAHLAELRQERMKQIAHLSRTQVKFERQLLEGRQQ